MGDDSRIKLYPNPAVEYITIQNIQTTTEPVNLDIYSSTGQLIIHQQLSDKTATVSVNELGEGNYFIRLYNSQINSTKRFSKL